MDNGKEIWNSTKDIKIMTGVLDDNLALGSYLTHCIRMDIKRLGFSFSRYKFATKMFENMKNIDLLELGCNEGFGTYFYKQSNCCKNIVGVDFDDEAIRWARENLTSDSIKFIEDDFMNKKYGEFDVVVSLDVIEHIDKSLEEDFLDTVTINLKSNGFAVIGTPSKNMYPYGSDESKAGHINLYDQKMLYDLLIKKFNNVFIFGMNDEIVHTGFYPMACYIIALCCNKKIEEGDK